MGEPRSQSHPIHVPIRPVYLSGSELISVEPQQRI